MAKCLECGVIFIQNKRESIYGICDKCSISFEKSGGGCGKQEKKFPGLDCMLQNQFGRRPLGRSIFNHDNYGEFDYNSI